jgi:hypothetical protein
VEASRKHGPFDMRWSCARRDDSVAASTAAPLRAAEAAEALDWETFSPRYFRARRRHDAEARSAYAAYKQGREWRTLPARLTLVSTDGVSAAVEGHEWEEAGTRRLIAAIAAAHDEREPAASAATTGHRGGGHADREI